MSDKKTTTLIIADDHHIVRLGIKTLLKEEFDFIIYEAANGDELFEAVKKYLPDIVLMDINMPNTPTQSILQNILLINPDLGVLMFSVNKEEIYGKMFLKLGARGYIQKDALSSELVNAIKCILSGNIYIRKEMRAFYLGMGNSSSPYADLSKKELEILQYIVKGESITSIAKKLNLSPSTIGTHKAHIFEKLHVSNNFELKEFSSLHQLV